jgi:hypothetical protein
LNWVLLSVSPFSFFFSFSSFPSSYSFLPLSSSFVLYVLYVLRPSTMPTFCFELPPCDVELILDMASVNAVVELAQTEKAQGVLA